MPIDSWNWDEAKAASDAYAAVYEKSDAAKNLMCALLKFAEACEA